MLMSGNYEKLLNYYVSDMSSFHRVPWCLSFFSCCWDKNALTNTKDKGFIKLTITGYNPPGREVTVAALEAADHIVSTLRREQGIHMHASVQVIFFPLNTDDSPLLRES